MNARNCSREVVIAFALSMVSLLGSAGVSDAASSGVSEKCGYLGGGEYRHCDGGTRSTVDLDVEDIWGNDYRYCVGPGTTNLQPVIRWRVTGAWWNGGVGCDPGYEGPA